MNKNSRWFTASTIARVLACTFLILAVLGKDQYAFFQILRWLVCGVAAWSGLIALEREMKIWAGILFFNAVLFNPILPFHLQREMWQVLDVISAGILIVSLFFVKKSVKRRSGEGYGRHDDAVAPSWREHKGQRERRINMGDKGKKDKEKGQKQNTEKQKQEEKKKQEKQPKRSP